MADDFTRTRLEWLEALHDDPQITSVEFETAFGISMHLNRKTGEAWPGLALLAKKVGVSERTVHAAIKKLVTCGYLIKRRGGDGRPNHYRLITKKEVSDRKPISDQNGHRSEAHFRSELSIRSEMGQRSDRKSDAFQIGSGLPTNPLRNPLKGKHREFPTENLSVFSQPIDHRSLPAPTVGDPFASRGALDALSASVSPNDCAEKKDAAMKEIQETHEFDDIDNPTPEEQRLIAFNSLWEVERLFEGMDKRQALAAYDLAKLNGESDQQIFDRLIAERDKRHPELDRSADEVPF